MSKPDEKTSKFKIVFKTKEQIRGFREPLNRIGFASGVGIILNINENEIKVNAVSDTNNILGQVVMKVSSVCESIEIDGEVDVGILEYENFLSCFEMFESEFEIEFDGERFIFQDKNNTSKLEFFSTRPDTIQHCSDVTPKKFGTSFVDFTLKLKNIQKIVKAFSILGEDLLKISSNEKEKKLDISIANKGKSNSYSFSIDYDKAPSQSFEMFYSHDHLMNLFKCNSDMDISITEKALMSTVCNDQYSIRYYISRRS